MTAKSMIVRARKDIGLGEPNYIQRRYRNRNGPAYAGNFPWCDAAVTIWALDSKNHRAVCPNGDRAYTVWHAQDFRGLKRWKPGTSQNIRKFARPGHVVFFDWGGSNTISRIDHVGIVERNLGDGRVVTIEGNTSDKCLRRVRGANVIAGFGIPKYSATSGKQQIREQEDDLNSDDREWLEKKFNDLPKFTWGWDHIKSDNPDNPNWTPKTYLRALRKRLDELHVQLGRMQSMCDELVKVIAVGNKINGDSLIKLVREASEAGATEALGRVNFDVYIEDDE